MTQPEGQELFGAELAAVTPDGPPRPQVDTHLVTHLILVLLLPAGFFTMPLRLSITIEADEATTEVRVLERLRDLLAEVGEVQVESRLSAPGRRWPRPVTIASPPPDFLGLVQKLAPGSHIEFATVVAFAAEVKGLSGLDAPTVHAWSQTVGWDQPADWRYILANATRGGYLQTAGRGSRMLAPKGRSLIEARLNDLEARGRIKTTN